MTAVADVTAVAEGPWLRSRAWDRIFVLGGALLVPIPILTFYLCQALGMPIAASEDVVTLLVMVAVGGPHVFATYTRTYLEPRFRRQQRGWAIGGLLVFTLVVAATLVSSFGGMTIFGFPPIQFVLTFFFFWAGVHIIHQMSFCAAAYGKKAGKKRSWTGALDYLVMLGCLYPVSFFRMSMIDPATRSSANMEALASKIVLSISGSEAFTQDYIFRIGRTAPILPGVMTADAFWVAFTALFFVGLGLWIAKSYREAKNGELLWPRFALVAMTVAVGLTVPLFPNLDSAFQGFNAWHSFQYIGVLWLMNRISLDRGEVESGFVKKLSGPGQHRRYYRISLFVTFGLIAVLFAGGWLIQTLSEGRFAMFGADPNTIPIDPATGRPEYRPGALLLAYYMFGFGFLLVHYLHDGMHFFRTRLLVD